MIRFGPVSRVSLAFLASALACGSTLAQTSLRCEAEEYRQFDFWVGEWTVSGPDGGRVGRSRVSVVMDGCVIREEWDSGQVRGTSLSVYDRPRERWSQTWVDNRGVQLRLEGGFDDGAMVLGGSRLGGDGTRRRFRVTWRPTGECGVRQVQRVSEDGGETWNVGFEGIYRPADGRCPAAGSGSDSGRALGEEATR